MRQITTWIAIGAFAAAISANAAFAGAPDSPGGLGQFLSNFAQTNDGLGGVASDPIEGRDNIPDGLDDQRESNNAYPNPANDNGGGN